MAYAFPCNFPGHDDDTASEAIAKTGCVKGTTKNTQQLPARSSASVDRGLYACCNRKLLLLLVGNHTLFRQEMHGEAASCK
jgi:hypothetical protein